MSFQTLATKATVSAALTASVLTFTSSADALNVRGSLSVSGGGTVSTNSVVFADGTVDTSSNDFTQFDQATVSLKPLTFDSVFTAPISSRATAPISPFIEFGTFTKGATSGALTFALDPSPIATFQTRAGVLHVSFPEITGRFLLDDQPVAFGNGFISASNTGSGGSYSISLLAEPIPTPALLPGLLGLGVISLRKRRETQESVETSEIG